MMIFLGPEGSDVASDNPCVTHWCVLAKDIVACNHGGTNDLVLSKRFQKGRYLLAELRHIQIQQHNMLVQSCIG
eukprot:CAMPEP_0176427990 /NCGR_PEP_ID=MMETSP0127-20121128/12900_1 /TAXON_ID=938130 /ORGANISM="Platyophrya macrostoma, Strain WH" /LENGTH=73 /DNA_ID=CAMNT_0017809621 /DNA_START=9 /DNA_END=227 /DNA_ORIENTATION=-